MTTMKTQTMLILILIKVALVGLFILSTTGCTSMSDVMPKQGASMEQVYDGMNKSGDSTFPKDRESMNSNSETDIKNIRSEVPKINATPTALRENVSAQNTWQSFQKVSNPTLKLYVYPHLAGNDELPVPGYTTAFSAYEKDHYDLRN